MTEREMESIFELDVDRRKLIVTFTILIVICGCFFVWGFMAGKRQGMQLSAAVDMEAAPVPAIEEAILPSEDIDEAGGEAQPLEEDAVQQDLDWYQSVNKKERETVGVQPSRSAGPAKKEAETPPAPVSNATPAAVTYSVQVGAFKRRPEADAHARNVRSKGFDSRVEAPASSGQLYMVKVGKFDTRAEAVAVQLRLRNNGFSCFVKTN